MLLPLSDALSILGGDADGGAAELGSRWLVCAKPDSALFTGLPESRLAEFTL